MFWPPLSIFFWEISLNYVAQCYTEAFKHNCHQKCQEKYARLGELIIFNIEILLCRIFSYLRGYVLGPINNTVRHMGHLFPIGNSTQQEFQNWTKKNWACEYYLSSPWSIDWCRQERQNECPHGVVTGSYNSLKHNVHSKSSVLSSLARLAPAAIFVFLSRSLRHVCKTWLYM